MLRPKKKKTEDISDIVMDQGVVGFGPYVI